MVSRTSTTSSPGDAVSRTFSRAACASCSGQNYVTKTLITGMPLIYCPGFTTVVGGSTYTQTAITTYDPDPNPYSAQPQITGNVPYGDLDPAVFFSAISKSCTSGCGGTFTTSAVTYPVPTPYTKIVQAYPTPLVIPYVITGDAIPAPNTGTFLQAVVDIGKSSSTNTSFEWVKPALHIPQPGPGGGNTTQFYGPSFVSLVRYSINPVTHIYDLNAGEFAIQITSYAKTNDPSCSSIAGPLASVLGLIPEIGPILGIIGSLICTVIGK